MPKRRPKKTIKTADVAKRLHKARAKRTKNELIDVLVELARDDRNVLRQLDARFELEAPPQELAVATRQAIAEILTSATSTVISATTTQPTAH